MQENFKKVKLDSVTAIAHVPVLGDFAIKLENVKLEGLALDGTSTGVSLADDGTFVLLVQGLDAVVNGHFQWRRTKFPFISGGAQAQVTAVVRIKGFGLQISRYPVDLPDCHPLVSDQFPCISGRAQPRSLQW